MITWFENHLIRNQGTKKYTIKTRTWQRLTSQEWHIPQPTVSSGEGRRDSRLSGILSSLFLQCTTPYTGGSHQSPVPPPPEHCRSHHNSSSLSSGWVRILCLCFFSRFSPIINCQIADRKNFHAPTTTLMLKLYCNYYNALLNYTTDDFTQFFRKKKVFS